MTPTTGNIDLSNLEALDNFIKFFRAASVHGYENLLPYAIVLLLLLFSLDIVFSWSIYNGSMRMQELLGKLTKVGILIFTIHHMPEINSIIIRSFEQWGLIAAGVDFPINELVAPSTIIDYSIGVLKGVWTAWEKVSFFSGGGPSTFAGCLIATLCVLYSFFMMAIELMMAIIEFNILASMLVILIPFAALKQTSFLFQRCVSAIINYGIKLMIIYFLIALVTSSSFKLTQEVSTASLATMITQSLIYLALGYIVSKVPTLITGMLQGQPAMSGQGVAGAIASTPGKVIAGAGAVGAIYAASKVKGVNGWDTFTSTAVNMGKNALLAARSTALNPIGKKLLHGADKTNEHLRAGKALKDGSWKVRTNEEMNNQAAKNTPKLTKKAAQAELDKQIQIATNPNATSTTDTSTANTTTSQNISLPSNSSGINNTYSPQNYSNYDLSSASKPTPEDNSNDKNHGAHI